MPRPAGVVAVVEIVAHFLGGGSNNRQGRQQRDRRQPHALESGGSARAGFACGTGAPLPETERLQQEQGDEWVSLRK